MMIQKKNVLLILFLAISIHINSSTSEIPEVPFGNNILPNGKFSQNEWSDADSCLFCDSIKFYVKQDENYVYLALKFLQEKHSGIDLYLADSKTNLKNLHISSALGERNFKENEWEEFVWGENILWTGNSIGSFYSDGKMQFLDPDGFEFQIDNTLFKKKSWFLRIHLKRPEFIYPSNTNTDSKENWFEIELKE